MFVVGATLMTTDAPWVFCWVLLVVALWHAVQRGAWWFRLLAGAAVGRRMTQHEVWGGLDDLQGPSGRFVTYAAWDAPEHVGQAGPALRRLALVPVPAHGQPLETFSVFRCDDFQSPTVAATL